MSSGPLLAAPRGACGRGAARVDPSIEMHHEHGAVEMGQRAGEFVEVAGQIHDARTVPAAGRARRVGRYRAGMSIDVTDATFQTEVIDRSLSVPVIVDLWAPWCGPCKTLGPILEKVVDATGGQVVLVKVDTDQNPAVAQAFQVQSIPAVYALKDGKVIDGFTGAYPEHVVQQFVDGLLPSEGEQTIAALLAEGTEGAFRAVLELDPANEEAIIGLAELLIARGEHDQALAFLARIPEDARTRAAVSYTHLTLPPISSAPLTVLPQPLKIKSQSPTTTYTTF